jgi:hypothetical protein
MKMHPEISFFGSDTGRNLMTELDRRLNDLAAANSNATEVIQQLVEVLTVCKQHGKAIDSSVQFALKSIQGDLFTPMQSLMGGTTDVLGFQQSHSCCSESRLQLRAEEGERILCSVPHLLYLIKQTPLSLPGL